MEKVLFEEKQRFDQWWMRLIAFGVLAIMGYSLYAMASQLSEAPDPTTKWTMALGISAAVVGSGAFLYIVIGACLHTVVKSDGIHFKFVPFVWKWKHIPKGEIQSVEVIKYSPIGDYGGWGYRFGTKGKALNVKGNMGMKIQAKKYRNLLIGTQHPERLRTALKAMNHRDQ